MSTGSKGKSHIVRNVEPILTTKENKRLNNIIGYYGGSDVSDMAFLSDTLLKTIQKLEDHLAKLYD